MKIKIANTFTVLSALLVGALGSASARTADLPELQVVPFVDLSKYLGTWYEIASFPQSFQKNCVATKATYSLRDDGDIAVLNECRKFSLDGKLSTAKGHAWVVDKQTNAKLKVSFFWPFWGKYWIIDLGANYEYAVVGHPDRDYLWILSRTPKLDDKVLQEIKSRLEAQHYDLSKLQTTLQPFTP